tara:strand:- start:468 stop:869 length:402 start_codon:yes stop_codon:yes gene_type:complete
MKDKDQQLIFEKYQKKRTRDGRIAYLREDFPDFDDEDDSSDNDEPQSESDNEESDNEGSDNEESSYEPSETSSPPPEDGKLSEEELDEELEILATKKDKISKLFDSESIDKDVAQEALAKLKMLTNDLVARYI